MVIVFCIILSYRCLKNDISRKTKHFGVTVFLVFENLFFADNWNRCISFSVNCMSRLLRLCKRIGYLKTWIRRATVTSWTWGKTSDFAVWHEVLTSNAYISESIKDRHIIFFCTVSVLPRAVESYHLQPLFPLNGFIFAGPYRRSRHDIFNPIMKDTISHDITRVRTNSVFISSSFSNFCVIIFLKFIFKVLKGSNKFSVWRSCLPSVLNNFILLFNGFFFSILYSFFQESLKTINVTLCCFHFCK
jgi:hypothetical protein